MMERATDGTNVCVFQKHQECHLLSSDPAFRVHPMSTWSDVVSDLISDRPSSVLVVCGLNVTQPDTDMIRVLDRRGLLPPTVVCCGCTTRQGIRRAWALASYSDDLVLERETLRETVRRIAEDSIDRRAVKYIAGRLNLKAPTTRASIRLLTSNTAPLTWDVEKIARRLGITTSTLYRALKSDGLPTVSRWQMLFRLLHAAVLLQQGVSTDDDAFMVRMADSRSLRRALADHFGTSVTVTRSTEGWRWLIQRWIDKQKVKT